MALRMIGRALVLAVGLLVAGCGGATRGVKVMPWGFLWRDDNTRQLGCRYLPASELANALRVPRVN